MKTQMNCSTCKNSKIALKGFLIVEGYTDMAFLSSFLDAEIVQIAGFSFSRETLSYIQELSKIRTPIIMSDPDDAGAIIRNRLLKILPNAEYVDVVHKKKEGYKNGVAECSKKEILTALKPFFSSEKTIHKSTVGTSDLIELNLIGPNTKERRDKIAKKLHLGECNTKTFLKRINSLKISREKIEEEMYGN
ncbi:MAG: ribonuclease M5 [Erysipelotrichaceae bacterium]|jgi:ribonuclease M5|nr:ribonuclease M5 [Erysipelotrichaceae bacterium]